MGFDERRGDELLAAQTSRRSLLCLGRLSMTCHSALQPLTLVTYLYYNSHSAAPTTPATGGEVAEANMARAERSKRTAADAPRRSGPR
jgi:hypothetical protein